MNSTNNPSFFVFWRSLHSHIQKWYLYYLVNNNYQLKNKKINYVKVDKKLFSLFNCINIIKKNKNKFEHINITIQRYFNYSNYYSIVIKAFYFKDISKEELDDFHYHYYPFFEKHIEPHVEDMFLGKKIEGLYLDNIISKKIVKAVSNFNKQYYKDFLTNLKMKIDIYDFLHNKTTTKEQKNYIYDKIFQYQYKRFIEESRKMYGTKIK